MNKYEYLIKKNFLSRKFFFLRPVGLLAKKYVFFSIFDIGAVDDFFFFFFS